MQSRDLYLAMAALAAAALPAAVWAVADAHTERAKVIHQLQNIRTVMVEQEVRQRQITSYNQFVSQVEKFTLSAREQRLAPTEWNHYAVDISSRLTTLGELRTLLENTNHGQLATGSPLFFSPQQLEIVSLVGMDKSEIDKLINTEQKKKTTSATPANPEELAGSNVVISMQGSYLVPRQR